MSREGAPVEREKAAERAAPPAAGTPIWVWLVYAVGLFSFTILVGSALFTGGGLFLSDEGDDYYARASITGFVLWGGLSLLAAGVWLWRRRQGRR